MRFNKNIIVAGGFFLAATIFPLCSVSAAESNSAVEEVNAVADAELHEAEKSKYADKIINPDTKKPCLSELDWKPEVKKEIEDFLGPYATKEIIIPHKEGKKPTIKNTPYAILKLDQTAGIDEVQEQVFIYQLDTLSFAMEPDKFAEVIKTGMNDTALNTAYNLKGDDVAIFVVMDDAIEAYGKLYKAGLIKAIGSNLKKEDKDKNFQEFKDKMLWLYKAINETQGPAIAKPWAGYFCTGMTPYEAYSLNINAIEKSKVIPSVKSVGQLVSAIKTSGFDVWVVSSGNYELVRAWLNHNKVPAVSGVLSMRTMMDTDGRYVNAYNYKYHAATYYKEGMLAAIKKSITGYYNTNTPAIIAEDVVYAQEQDTDFDLCEVYPKAKLRIYFEDNEAIEAVVNTDNTIAK